jgi:hypothetical protein
MACKIFLTTHGFLQVTTATGMFGIKLPFFVFGEKFAL